MVLDKSSNKNLHWLFSCSFLKIEVFLQQDIIKRNTKGFFAANKLFLPQKAKLFFSSLTTVFFSFNSAKKRRKSPCPVTKNSDLASFCFYPKTTVIVQEVFFSEVQRKRRAIKLLERAEQNGGRASGNLNLKTFLRFVTSLKLHFVFFVQAERREDRFLA